MSFNNFLPHIKNPFERLTLNTYIYVYFRNMHLAIVATLCFTAAVIVTETTAGRPRFWYHERCTCLQAEPGTKLRGKNKFRSQEDCIAACNVLCK